MENRYIEDLKEIKDIMSRTTRFISLSGLSGVSTGLIALTGALIANEVVFKGQAYLSYSASGPDSRSLIYLLLIATGTLVLSIGSAIFFTNRKTKLENQQVWDVQTKRLLINLLIPLVTGGLLCLMFLLKGFVAFIFPLSLIFYGLALVNGSKYTIPDIRNLGFVQIILGLISFQFIEQSLIFWAVGFGFIQILFGLYIQRKYRV